MAKFEDEDLPKILAALHTAKESKTKGSVTVQFDDKGGVLSVIYDAKRSFK